MSLVLRYISGFILGVIVTSVVGFGFSQLALAQPSYTINYQGKLTTPTGVAVADGTYTMEFKLYTVSSGGIAIWTETRNGGNQVTVQNGLFSVMLGSVSSLTSVNFNQPLYLGVNINGDGEMTPRKVIGSVPSAFEAKQLGGVASSSFLRSDQADTAGSLLTFNGGLISNSSSTLARLSFTNATGTSLFIGGDRITDFVGSGLTLSGSTLTATLGTDITAGEIANGDHGFFSYSGGVASLDNNSITPNSILTTGQTDEYCLTYEGTGATFEWQLCAAAGLAASDINTSAEIAAIVGDETGSGALVFGTSPTLVTPNLGTPSALVGTNITGTAAGLTAGNVTTNANLTGAITSTGNATALGSFSSANLRTALTDETGLGVAVFNNEPTFVDTGGVGGGTITLGVSGMTIATDGDGAITFFGLGDGADENLTLNLDDTANTGVYTSASGLNLINFSGIALQESGSNILSVADTDTSTELAAILGDETGTGSVVFSASPTFTGTPVLPSSFTIGGNTFARAGAFALTLTNTAATNVTLPTSGTLYGTAASSITSAQLLSSLSDETGTGNAVFSASPTFTGTLTAAAADFSGIVDFGSTSYISSNGIFRTVLGSVAAPSYSFENDIDSGFYTPGDGAIRFSSNNSNVFSIINGGNVGIGTTTPSQRLAVGATAGSQLLVSSAGVISDGTWQGDIIADTYISDTLTIGAGSTFANNIITPNAILTTGQTDEYCLTYEGTGATFEWQTCGAAGLASTDIDTSAELRGILTDETGTGALVFGTAPTFTTSITSPLIYGGTGASSQLILRSTSGTGTTDDIIMGIGTDGATQAFRIDNENDSVMFGEDAGLTFTSGTIRNVAIGYEAGKNASTTNVDYNNFIGYQAGINNTGASNNIFGRNAGLGNTGSENNLLGLGSGRSNSGSNNNIFGQNTGFANTGSNSNLFGLQAGYFNSGANNNLFGPNSGTFNTGSYVNLFGFNSGYSNTGSNNNFFGFNAGYNNTGSTSIMMGYRTGEFLRASSSVVIGGEAMRGTANFTAPNNVAIGQRAGYVATTGAWNNILIGYQAADNLTTGNNNIIIGYDIDNVTATADNRLNIGNLIFGTGLDGTGTTLASGNVGIGTASPQGRLHVSNGTSGSGIWIDGFTAATNPTIANNSNNEVVFRGSGGNTGNGIAYNFVRYDTAASLLTVTNAGRVGIGTTTPSTQLQIYGAGQTTSALTDSGNSGGTLYLTSSDGGVDSGGTLLFGAERDRFAAIKALYQDGNGNGVGDLAFSTRNVTSDTALTERMRILAGGNVGIGDSSPTSKLQVVLANASGGAAGISNWDNTFVTFGGSTANSAAVGLGMNTTDGGVLLALDPGNAWKNMNYGATEHRFFISGGEAARIDSSSNLMVGTSANLNTTAKFRVRQASTANVAEFYAVGSDSRVIIANDSNLVAIREAGGLNLMYNNGGTLTDGLRLTHAGDVGIGTQGPGSRLHIQETDRVPLLSMTKDGIITWKLGNFDDSTVDNYFHLGFNGSKVITVDTNERVGIGTVSPNAKLTISNNVATNFLDAYSEYQLMLFEGGSAANSYGLGIKTSTMVFNSGAGGYSFDRAGAATSMVIDTAGSVGIGTTGPAGLLHVQGSANGARTENLVLGNSGAADNSSTAIYMGYQEAGLGLYGARILQRGYPSGTRSSDLLFQIHNGTASNADGAWDTPLMIERTTGDVGISTTTPDAKLTVLGGSSGANTGIFSIVNNGGSAANSGSSVQFKGVNGSGIYREMARIGTLLQGGTNGAESSDLAFSTINSGTLAERMRILAGGNVGIGDVSPDQKLSVTDTLAITNSGGAQFLLMGNQDSAGVNNPSMIVAANGNMEFGNGTSWTGSGGTFTSRLMILDNGNVGVGIQNPVGKFEVNHGNGSDGTVFYSSGDNSQSIQSYIDGQWSNRATYASGCCNTLNINTDAGDIVMGSSGRTLTVNAATTINSALTATGNITSGTAVYAAGASGFYSTSFVSNARNPIWRFANADAFGMSYFQGTSGLDGANDTIGFHFGTASAAASVLTVNQQGTVGVNGDLGVAGAIKASDPSYSTKRYINVAQFAINAASQTGTIKIAMPASKRNSDTMHTIRITGYEYTSGQGAWEVLIGGYTYSGGWINTSVNITGTPPFTSVRLADDGVNDLILLGTTATVWQYPQIFVDDYAGYSAQDGFDAAWTTSLITSEVGITVESTPLVKTFATAAGSFGIGDVTPDKMFDVEGNAVFGAGGVSTGSVIDVGSTATDYPALNGWQSTFDANMTLHGLNTTSIAFHDAGTSVGALSYTNNWFNFDGAGSWGPARLGINDRTPDYTLDVAGDMGLDNTLYFTQANPIINASSYVSFPGGIYVSGGTPYFQNEIQARGGINDDTNGTLTIRGGLNDTTAFTGKVITSRFGSMGVYNSSEVQGIWTIGDGYNISTASNNFGNQYGMNYAYGNTAGAPFAGQHQIIYTDNGVIGASISLVGQGYFKNDVGIGRTDPQKRLDVYETVADSQLRVSYNGSTYTDFQTDSSGDLTIDASGGDVRLLNENFFACSGGSCASTPNGAGTITSERAITAEEGTLGTSGSITVNWDDGNQQRVGGSAGNMTFTFSNATAGQTLRLVVCYSGAHTITWGSTIRWAGGTAPTPTSTNGKCDVFSFIYTGTEYLGQPSLNF